MLSHVSILMSPRPEHGKHVCITFTAHLNAHLSITWVLFDIVATSKHPLKHRLPYLHSQIHKRLFNMLKTWTRHRIFVISLQSHPCKSMLTNSRTLILTLSKRSNDYKEVS